MYFFHANIIGRSRCGKNKSSMATGVALVRHAVQQAMEGSGWGTRRCKAEKRRRRHGLDLRRKLHPVICTRAK